MTENKNIVYIGFGSVTIPTPNKNLRAIISAVEQAGVQAIVHDGWSGRIIDPKDSEPIAADEFGKNIFFLKGGVPHDWLFAQPHIRAVFNHGGAGTASNGTGFV